MKRSHLVGALCAGVFCFVTLSSHAALVSRLGGQAVYDTVLDITWLADANAGAGSAFDDGVSTTDGFMTWASAKAWAANLMVGGVTGWRLPTTTQPDSSCSSQTGNPPQGLGFNCAGSEMGHLYNELGGIAGGSVLSSGDPDLALFTNIQSGSYWSSTELALAPTNAWFFAFNSGFQNATDKNSSVVFAWAVHSGDVGAAPADLLASVLPGKRTVQVGTPATALAAVVNTGTTVATGCSIAPATMIDATFLYQTTDPATNALTGTANTPVDIGPGGVQTFLFAFTPNSAFLQTSISLIFDCTNTPPAPASVVNAFSLGASATPVPDIIALAVTAENDGIVHLPTTEPDTGVFSVASINVGATGMVDVTGDTGMASLPVSVSVCETNPQTGVCINPAVPAGNSMRQYAASQTATHSIFVDPSDTVALDPANHRVYVNFQGVGNSAEGVTSVAVEGGAAASGSGGGGSGIGPLGSLNIAGPDTGVIGDSYSPEVSAFSSSSPTASAVAWTTNVVSMLNVGLDGTSAVIVTFNIVPTGDVSLVYAYSLNCFLTPAECSNISTDLANQTMTFNNLTLPVTQNVGFGTNLAIGSIVLNGTLSWE